MTTVTVKLPEKLGHELEIEARRRRTSKSEVIRMLLERGLSEERSASGASCYDLARDLCGSVEGASTDLSSNKRHLEGFGK